MGKDLTTGGVYSTIVKTSAPMVIAFALQSAFNIVDAFFVGKISPQALAAVSISFPVVFLIISIGTGVGVGATSVVARYTGAKMRKKAENAAEHALVAALVLGLVLAVSGYLASPALFDLIGANPELKSLGLDYLNILLLFSPGLMVGFVGNSILRGEGDMMTPMKAMAGGAFLNIVLDPLFIFTLGLGVRGAALATVTSRGIGICYLLFHIFRGRSWIRLDYSSFKYDFEYIKQIFSVGIPGSLSNVTMSVGMFLMTAIVGLFGVDALAAFGVGFRLDTLAILPGLGVMTAVISMVGQNIGAGKVERARQVTVKAGLMASALMSLTGFVFYVFATPIISVFNDSPKVIEIGVGFLKIIPYSYLVVGLTMSFSGAFIGSGKAKYALLVTFSRMLLFGVPIAYILSRSQGIQGIWTGIVAGSYLGFIVGLVLFKWGKWQRQKKYLQTNQ